MKHFWIICVRGNKKWQWRAFEPWDGCDNVIAYPTRKDAKGDLDNARKLYGEARLFKVIIQIGTRLD